VRAQEDWDLLAVLCDAFAQVANIVVKIA